jgi:DNA invertase Pin-like site-specific DNA recombinase
VPGFEERAIDGLADFIKFAAACPETAREMVDLAGRGRRAATAERLAVGYIRTTVTKLEMSRDRQRAAITRLAEREGFRIVDWYEDQALTETPLNDRIQFLRMLEFASRGELGAILLYEESRFDRQNVFEVLDRLRTLNAANVEIVTCQRGRLDLTGIGGLINALAEQHPGG